VTATCHAYGKRIGKTPIIVNDAPGFYVNRILTPYMNEAALLLEEGVRIEEIDRALTSWGFPVGPITLYDEVGLDVAQKAGQDHGRGLRDRIEPNRARALVADGRLGRKNGRGFYRYEDGKKGRTRRERVRADRRPRRGRLPREEIQERLALVMVNEAVRTLEEGVLRSARDGDVGAVIGIGFPPFRGGPFWYIDQTGAARVLARLRALEARASHGAALRARRRCWSPRADTGIDTPSARDALRTGAERLGVTPASLRHVLLTHAHIDHYGLAGPVRAWSGAQVAMHADEEALARRFVDRWPAERAAPGPPSAAAGCRPPPRRRWSRPSTGCTACIPTSVRTCCCTASTAPCQAAAGGSGG
jgi:3-hydroxyacyl-CoA dehydrogenase